MRFEPKESFKLLVEDLKTYVEKRIELKTLEVQEKASVLAAAVLSNSLGLFLIAIGVVFLLFTLGLFLGDLLESRTLGFLALSLILIFIGILVYKTGKNAFKGPMEKAITSFVNSALDAGEKAHKRSRNKAEERRKIR
ncbi:MAG: phage holin family protein [Balneolales bacterium]|nr:phage holin family protein [Balneolales bacterium]